MLIPIFSGPARDLGDRIQLRVGAAIPDWRGGLPVDWECIYFSRRARGVVCARGRGMPGHVPIPPTVVGMDPDTRMD